MAFTTSDAQLVGESLGRMINTVKENYIDCRPQDPMIPKLQNPEDFAHARRLAGHVYAEASYSTSPDVAPPGYVTLRVSDVETGMWAGHPAEDPSTIWISVRGSRVSGQHFYADWVQANVKLAWGDMYDSGRLMRCHEFFLGCADLLQTGSKLRITGHSLGGTLALEMLRMSRCNQKLQRYDSLCIVFNPGYVLEPRHYRFLGRGFWSRVYVMRMCNDAVSYGILNSQFRKNNRVWTLISEASSYNPISPHYLETFDEFDAFHYNDDARLAKRQAAVEPLRGSQARGVEFARRLLRKPFTDVLHFDPSFSTIGYAVRPTDKQKTVLKTWLGVNDPLQSLRELLLRIQKLTTQYEATGMEQKAKESRRLHEFLVSEEANAFSLENFILATEFIRKAFSKMSAPPAFSDYAVGSSQ